MEKKIIDPSTVPGWGIDANPSDTPNYPIKHYTGDDHNRKNWNRPTLQPVNTELLMSTERPFESAVFGTGNPPKGLSGIIRRMAFKYSENMNRRWVPLILADRVDGIESIFGDIFLRGHVPNVIAERGWGAIAKHKPALLAGKIALRLIILGAMAGLVVYIVHEARD